MTRARVCPPRSTSATKRPRRATRSPGWTRARAEAPLVRVAADVAARIDAGELDAALAALAPLTLVVPDLAGAAPMPDVAAVIRRDLGLEGAP